MFPCWAFICLFPRFAIFALASAEDVASPRGPLETRQADSSLVMGADDECRMAGDADSDRCALSALQRRATQVLTDPENCHSATAGEVCWKEVEWATKEGIRAHPDWYPGLSPSSSADEFQNVIHMVAPEKCPAPCGVEGKPLPAPPTPPKWCDAKPLARLWTPKMDGPHLEIKVLSYNLFWWNLFGLRGGAGDSAGRLIAGSNRPQPYDFMGFQECEDPVRLLAGQGLLKEFEAFQGENAICMAYAKGRWKLLERGQVNVAEDMPTKWYGRRSAQWMRLIHIKTGRTAFFMNHHGPLSVNSGGICGGEATARNMLSVLGRSAQAGDLLILVGDFNANAASVTIQEIWKHLVHVHNGDSWAGVDNIFSNANANAIMNRKILGSGGSDHNAISAVIAVGADESASVAGRSPYGNAANAAQDLAKFPPGQQWSTFWCGKLEQDIEYVWPDNAGIKVFRRNAPETCCKACQEDGGWCKAWLWVTWAGDGPICKVAGSLPSQKKRVPTNAGIVSGLSAAMAAREAVNMVHTAISIA